MKNISGISEYCLFQQKKRERLHIIKQLNEGSQCIILNVMWPYFVEKLRQKCRDLWDIRAEQPCVQLNVN